MMDFYSMIIGTISGWMYSYILIILLLAVGFYFTVKTKFVQFKLVAESIRVLREKKPDADAISSFQALMVSTASRVGVGNIAGVSVAISLGGAGAVFWMWVTAILGASSAFIESTLAQIYKKRDSEGGSYGGPAYYIEAVLKSRTLGVLFALMLIFTYMGGFNMVASFNIAEAFKAYGFYTSSTPMIIGIILAVFTGLTIFGGALRVSKITGVLVPLMASVYIFVALVVMFSNFELIPGMFVAIFQGAFDFEAIFGGFAGSAIMQGIKRGLYSNEAGVGSAPNAAASASVSHPVKQGLVQMLSVYIDTLVICTATAFMLLCSGITPSAEIAGVPFVQQSIATMFGETGVHLTTFALFCFAFTSILGNFFYAESNLKYLVKSQPSQAGLFIFRAVAVIIVFVGAQLKFGMVWDTADVLMGGMALINLPVIVLLGGPAIACLNDYMKQKKEGKNPVFKSSDINLPAKTEFWND